VIKYITFFAYSFFFFNFCLRLGWIIGMKELKEMLEFENKKHALKDTGKKRRSSICSAA